jgi:hypothetical protein
LLEFELQLPGVVGSNSLDSLLEAEAGPDETEKVEALFFLAVEPTEGCDHERFIILHVHPAIFLKIF